MNGPAGRYEVAVLFDRGAAAMGRQTVVVGEAASLPKPAPEAAVWDDKQTLAGWLAARGAVVGKFDPAGRPGRREVILIGETGKLGDERARQALVARVRQGSIAAFLAPEALGTPFAGSAKQVDSAPYWWGRDDIVKPHPIFAGLPSRCLMDLTVYRDVIPYKSFTEFDPGWEVLVPSFALGRPGSGYWSGANMAIYRLGEGQVIVSTLRLLENLGRHPAADRIVLNLVSFAAGQIHGKGRR